VWITFYIYNFYVRIQFVGFKSKLKYIKMKKILTILLVLAIIVLGVIFILDNPFSNDSEVLENNKKDGPGIILSFPSEGDFVKPEFTVLGEANTFEANVIIEIENSDGESIYEESVIADMPDVGQWGPFEKQVNLENEVNEGDEITVKAYDLSAKDGSVQYENKAVVTIKNDGMSQSDETMNAVVYFGNSNLSDGIDCSEVYKVEKIVPYSKTVGASALNKLLEGPTEEDKDKGYFTSLPEGVKLNSLKIKSGVAYADFNEKLNNGGGSCSMLSRKSQIEHTLKEFSTVESVEISVNGETENILQP
jgi:spore germination protein GerM